MDDDHFEYDGSHESNIITQTEHKLNVFTKEVKKKKKTEHWLCIVYFDECVTKSTHK